MLDSGEISVLLDGKKKKKKWLETQLEISRSSFRITASILLFLESGYWSFIIVVGINDGQKARARL